MICAVAKASHLARFVSMGRIILEVGVTDALAYPLLSSLAQGRRDHIISVDALNPFGAIQILCEPGLDAFSFCH
ncbi:MAG: hypothetical protein C7B45_15965 [Sulfobacillus acidophilus]|uniref:Uncharacterized protein n=1 Tax=Sulfobacillus acidophilus TaxID=53633 RepID=A0A2T2WD83_9FIRM|nr:MAG: hypothetical protein C7B45_15965 [Sulfobacillus acidophilus]